MSIMLKIYWHKQIQNSKAPSITESELTGLNEQELLGLCAHLIWSSAVIAPKVIFRLWGYLEEEEGKEANIWRAVYQNRWTNLCVKHSEGDLFVCPLE